MPAPRRHGLPTLLIHGDSDAARTSIEHLLSGRKTVIVRPVLDPDEEPLERTGERVLIVDSAGLSIAVVDVVSTVTTVLGDVDAATRRADDPDYTSPEQWAITQLARWHAAGLPVPNPVDRVPVVAVGVRVVGLEVDADRPEIEAKRP